MSICVDLCRSVSICVDLCRRSDAAFGVDVVLGVDTAHLGYVDVALDAVSVALE